MPTGVIRISPGPSRQLALFIWISHLSALCLILLPAFPPWLKLLLPPLILLSLIHTRNTHILRSTASAITAAEWDGEDEWLLFTGHSKKYRARLLGSSYVQPWLMVLNFICIGKSKKRVSLILMPDSLDADRQRRLRVKLRLQ
jgi:toxin CptA